MHSDPRSPTHATSATSLPRQRLGRTLRLMTLATCGLATWLATAGMVAAQSGLARNYTSSAQRLDAQVSTWGEDCGPRPQSQTFDEQVAVKVSEDGAHLVLRYPDRTLRTNGCWSPNVAVKLISATASSGRFRAECRTPDGDAKRELGRYTVTATPGKLELVEESEYDWQLKKSHCVAKVRMTQTLTSGDKPAAVPDASVTAPAQAPVEPRPACVPGPATRIRLRPEDARVAPGERVCFSVRGFDAAGCSKELAAHEVDFVLGKPSGAEATLHGACFRAAPNAALAEGVFKVTVSSAGMRDSVNVSVSALDLSDITARRGPSGNGTLGQNPAADETVFESGIRAVASGSHGLLWLSLALAGVAAVLSTIAIFGMRLARRRAAALAASESTRPGPVPRSQPAPTVRPVAPALAPAPPATGPQRICPRCRRGYAPFTERCAIDNEPLLDYAEFVKRSEQKVSPRSCPKCAEPMASDALFCGRCGHKVQA